MLYITDINYMAPHYRPGMGSIFSNMLETVAPIKLKKVREKRAAPWYNSYTHFLKKETRILEREWRKTNLEVFRIAW